MNEPERRVYANRTLNMRSVEAVGYDMDYTLLHYRPEEWEGAAFEHARQVLAEGGYPVEDLEFDADRYLQGLVVDIELGNLVKASRFGYVIQAQHGTRTLTFDELRRAYNGVVVDLSEPRFRFLNTMFSISVASLYAQLVDRLDAGVVTGPLGYDELFKVVSVALDTSHTVGTLKAEIAADPDRFCDLDPDTAQAIKDQRLAGKKTLLITNSEWTYTNAMMGYAFNSHAPGGNWRELFDIVVVAASKPRFFTEEPPVYEVVDRERSLLQPHLGLLEPGGVYHGGSARLVERSLGLDGAQILYVGDHLFGDVHVSKSLLRWRTALIMRELEAEIADAARFADSEVRLRALMNRKIDLEDELSHARLDRTRAQADGTPSAAADARMSALYAAIRELDQKIAPLAIAAGALGNVHWGPLMRAGTDKSLFARQVEKFADVYTSRVANFARHTPYAFLRAARTSLPHDQVAAQVPEKIDG